jgi:hypothetical protein
MSDTTPTLTRQDVGRLRAMVKGFKTIPVEEVNYKDWHGLLTALGLFVKELDELDTPQAHAVLRTVSLRAQRDSLIRSDSRRAPCRR